MTAGLPYKQHCTAQQVMRSQHNLTHARPFSNIPSLLLILLQSVMFSHFTWFLCTCSTDQNGSLAVIVCNLLGEAPGVKIWPLCFEDT